MRLGLIAVLTVVILVAPLMAAAQPGERTHTIAFLSALPSSVDLEPFRLGLRELGYVEGKNIVIVARSAEGHPERLPELAAELVRLNVNVIAASSNPAVAALKQATRTIPIVMTSSGDPVGVGFVTSLARPGGNITGLSNMSRDVSAKRLELLKELKPTITRVAVLKNPTSQTHVVYARETQEGARRAAIRLVVLDVTRAEDFRGAFDTMLKERVEAFIVFPHPVTTTNLRQIVALAAETRLPGMYPFKEWTDAGGLVYYGPSRADMLRRAAAFVDRILKGAKPADLPVEQPTKFELVINLKTARLLGLTIPPSLLLRADQVIE